MKEVDYVGMKFEDFQKLGVPYRVLEEDGSFFLSCQGDIWICEQKGYFIWIRDGIITNSSLAGKEPFKCYPPVLPKTKPVWFRRKRVELGEGHIIQYTLFESKKLFGIIIYHWKTIKQNRFHSHAFPAYAFLLRGSYTEEVIENGQIVTKTVDNRFKPRYIPQNYVHRIMKAEPKTWTIVFTGRWAKFWYEYFPERGMWRKYTWGRKKVQDIKGNETTDIINGFFM